MLMFLFPGQVTDTLSQETVTSLNELYRDDGGKRTALLMVRNY